MNKNYPHYTLTHQQYIAFQRIAMQWKHDVLDLIAKAYPEVGNQETACVMVEIGRDLNNPTMVLGIERDGHTHS